MKNRRNYYRLLHVQPDAPAEIIRSSYRTLMHRMGMHPDMGGDNTRAAMLTEAYETLSNPAKRAQYDSARPGPLRGTFREDNGRTEVSAPPALPDAQPANCVFCCHPQPSRHPQTAESFCAACKSPLALPRPVAIADDERRTMLRVPRQLPLTFYTHWPQEPLHARSSDISLRGLKFHSSAQLLENQLIKLDSRILRAVGRVTHSQQQGKQCAVGVEFVRLWFAQSRGFFVTARA
jgi:curved DNA-binding protein CbpA